MAWSGLVWIGLVPLLWVLHETRKTRWAFICGALAGCSFFLITFHPLLSAQSWVGWARESSEASAWRLGRQWWFLHSLWIGFALLGAMCWGVWAVIVHRLASGKRWRWMLVVSCGWVLIAEWVRVQITCGFTWAVLGNATAHVAAIRQLASLGGVWLLSFLVVMVNAALAQLSYGPRRTSWWLVPVTVLALAMMEWGRGRFLLARPLRSDETFQAAALQYHKTTYELRDFTSFGLDRGYVPWLQQALQQRVRLLVLPESIVLGAMSLDGTTSQMKPPEFHAPLTKWEEFARGLLARTPTVFVIGMDTVEQGRDHNTLVAWTAEGTTGWYHKQRLVPFAESHPTAWGSWVVHGQSQYAPGKGSQLIQAQGLTVGGFICQEVLIPSVTRQSVRDGASILVSGGNDGVFKDPAVAQVQAAAAQLRAVETGRYLVRAMKTGVSAIIDPRGHEEARSRLDEPVLLVGSVSPRRGLTPYVRWGDWVVWGSAAVLIWMAAAPRNRRRRLDATNRRRV